MRFNIHVLPRSSKNEIITMPDGTLKVRLTAPPVEGAANKALIKLLSEHLNIAKNAIKIIKGAKGKNKIIEVEN